MSFEPSWESGSSSNELRAGTAQQTFAVFFMLGALGCIAFGWWRMYAYDELGSDKIVGGDAMNMQIWAARGGGIITAGVGLAIIAVVFALFAVAAKLDSTPSP